MFQTAPKPLISRLRSRERQRARLGEARLLMLDLFAGLIGAVIAVGLLVGVAASG